MKNINKVFLAGNLIADADNDKVCKFCVASNVTAKDENGDWVDYPNFINCVAFGSFGDNIAEYLKKGTKVFVEGMLHQSRWEDKEGNKRSSLEVWVDNIEIVKSDAKKPKSKSYR